MKQAILVTAYKDYYNLIDLINYFDNSFLFYIHIDRKSTHNEGLLKKIRNNPKVCFVSRQYNVNWGGINHLKSYIMLASRALMNQDINYFHLISGQDFPIKSISHFKNIGCSTKPNNYLEYFELPTDGWSGNGGFDRINYYQFYDFINVKTHPKWINKPIYLQKKTNFKRKLKHNIPKLYGGSTWWSLNRETLQHVINYTSKNKKLINRLKYTFCPEEIYFQTVIMNSKFSINIINNNLRYIDWSSHQASPTILTSKNLDEIIESPGLFARKFETPVSNALKTQILSV